MANSHHPDPIRRDLTAYTVSSVLILLILIAMCIGAGLLLKQERKSIMRGHCYVAYDGDMICIDRSQVAR